MSKKNIKATDPRKRIITDTFKAVYFCRKTTGVCEDEIFFYATCFQRKSNSKTFKLEKEWVPIGQRKIPKDKLWSRDSSSYGIGGNNE